MGELIVPDDELPDELARGAHRDRPALARRVPAPPVGARRPARRARAARTGCRHFEQSLAVAARSGLPAEKLELAALVDDYVFGHIVRTAEVRRTMGDEEAAMRRMEGLIGYFEALMETGEYPTVEAAIGGNVRQGFARVAAVANDEGRFERGLQILLDGIALDLERRQSSRSNP